MKDAIPNPSRSEGEERKACSHRQGKEEASKKSRVELQKMGHGPFVGYRKITCLFYGDKGAIESDIGQVDLSSGNGLGSEQTKEDYKEWIKPSVFHFIL